MNSAMSTETYLTSLSPKEFLRGVLDYIAANDKCAYNYFTPKQLEGHIVQSFLHNQMCVAFGGTPSGPIIGGVATWEFRHDEKEIYLVGLIGSAGFARSLVRRWKRLYPFYKLAFARRDRRREHQPLVQPIFN